MSNQACAGYANRWAASPGKEYLVDKKVIESIVKDVLVFVKEEMFETTAQERRDLANFLRERLSRPTTGAVDGAKRCPECDSEVVVCMMGHYCGEVTPRH